MVWNAGPLRAAPESLRTGIGLLSASGVFVLLVAAASGVMQPSVSAVKVDLKIGETEEQRRGLRCPLCLGSDVVPSLPRGLFDKLLVQSGRTARHCRYCGRRFWVRAAKQAT
jgi:hypothetical protein